MSLEGKCVLIIGGSSGIGLATAYQAAAAGAKVVLVGRGREAVDAAAAEIGGSVRGYVADLSKEADLAALAGSVGRIHHLFSTPGPFLADPSIDLPEDVLREGMEVRFWSVVRLLRLMLPQIEKNGSVVLMSGTANWRPEGSPIALAALGAVETLVRSMAVSYAPIRFNAVAPGLTRTPFLKQFMGESYEQVLSSMASKVPLRRFAEPGEIAEAAIFLMRNNYVNGVTLTVDGGARLV